MTHPFKGGLMHSFFKTWFYQNIHLKTLIETCTDLEGGQRVKGQHLENGSTQNILPLLKNKCVYLGFRFDIYNYR